MAQPLLCVADVVDSLCRSLTSESTLRVKGPQEGYRCKATYSLTPQLVTSPLAQPVVNTLAESVAEFVSRHSVMQHIAPHFFTEVMGKVNRAGETLIKISFVNCVLSAELDAQIVSRLPGGASPSSAAATLFDRWFASAERAALSDFLVQRFPSLVAVVAHVCLTPPPEDPQRGSPPLVRKPDKACDYVPLLPNKATSITEYTPNGVPFQLSADSFCEVNQPMEDAICEAIKTFLRLDRTTGIHDPRDVFITGRDINSVVKTFEQYYATVTCATSCPSVFADAQINAIPNCQLVAKDELFKALHAFHRRHAPIRLSAPSHRHAECHVLLTAGRHGLHPRTSKMLAAMGAGAQRVLTDVIYVSCNVHSMARDLHVLKTSLFVADARTFDFFPGTEYVMTVLHLRPMWCRCAGGVPRLLVLPIGMPGSGKSLAGRALATFFSPTASDSDTHDASPSSASNALKAASKQAKKRRVEGQPRPFVPRSFSAVREGVRVVVFERDAVFRDLRTSGHSLKQTKIALHAALLKTVDGCDVPRQGHDGADGATVGVAATTHEDLVSSLLSQWTQRSCDSASRDNQPFSVPALFRVVYVDSTNGDPGARSLYASTFLSATNDGSGEASGEVIELGFNVENPVPEDVLLQRVRARKHHPAFPSDEGEQQRKLSSIGAMLRSDGVTAVAPSATRIGIDSAVSGEERFTVVQVLIAVCAHLWFSPHVAESIRSGAVACCGK